MKPFTLHTVLKHKKNLEEQAMYRLAKIREEENSIARQLAKEEQTLASLVQTLAREQALGIEVIKLARFERRIVVIEKQVDILQALLHKKKTEVNLAQEQLIARSKDKKIIETLQDKQNEAWQQYVHQKETATLDEIAVIFHERK